MGLSKGEFMQQHEENDWSDMFTSNSQLPFTEMATDEQLLVISELIVAAKVPYEVKYEIEKSINENTLTREYAFHCINYLNNSIGHDEIASGTNYNQTDIIKKLKKENK